MFCCFVKIMPTQPYAIAAETIPTKPMSANSMPLEKVVTGLRIPERAG